MNLSEHFTFEELTFSEVADRLGWNNDPPDRIAENLKFLAGRLEEVRLLLKAPMRITSGYRSPVVNDAVGGSVTSQHRFGLAADFKCPSFGTPAEVVDAIMTSDMQFDQLIDEYSWIHISFVRNNPRRMVGVKHDVKDDVKWLTR